MRTMSYDGSPCIHHSSMQAIMKGRTCAIYRLFQRILNFSGKLRVRSHIVCGVERWEFPSSVVTLNGCQWCRSQQFPLTYLFVLRISDSASLFIQSHRRFVSAFWFYSEANEFFPFFLSAMCVWVYPREIAKFDPKWNLLSLSNSVPVVQSVWFCSSYLTS